MILMNEIPDRFWGLFRSINRPTYIEALLRIREEYEYSNYFLSREVCLQVLSEYFSEKRVCIWQDEMEDEADLKEPLAARVLNWLLKAGWLKKVDDYATMTVNIVIPDYAAVMLEAFFKLSNDEEDETQIYIQNVYAILFSLRNDPRASVGLLNTACVNTRKLNKTLQDLLHNMDRFFEGLLEQKSYGALLREHLEGYVEEIVKKKYHILKTSDNFYLYKNDIKRWIRAMREDESWLHELCRRGGEELSPEDVLEKLDQLERGFDDIEHRISNLDREHSKYIRATVTRLNYLLNREDNMKGLIIQLLNHLSQAEDQEEKLKEVGRRMNLSQTAILSEKSLYKKRKPRGTFKENLMPEEEEAELSREEIMNLNRLKNRYSRREIEEYLESHMTDGCCQVNKDTVTSEEEFEKLILAYDYSTRRNSPYQVKEQEAELIDNGSFRYPALVFVRRKP